MNIKKVMQEDGSILTIEILVGFKVEEYDKQYVAYTLNDDNISETVQVLINEIDYSGETPRIVGIPENEKSKVIEIYNEIKKNI